MRYAFLMLLAACASGPPRPAPLDTSNETCAWCRMAVTDARLAAQLVAPFEEPRFFDDLGCLRDFLASTKALPEGAIAYVADHRTLEWAPAATAVYTKVPAIETPMGSHLIAHVDAASRDADPSSREGERLTAVEVFGRPGPPKGRP